MHWNGKLLVLFSALAAGCSDVPNEAPKRKSATDPAVTPLQCVPNLDGKIEASELAAAIGVPVHYTVNPSGIMRTVDLEGTTNKDGTHAWKLAADFADDQSLVVTPMLAKDQWYASSFPADAFVTAFDVAGQTDSIGELNDNGLMLLGLASHKENPSIGKTLLIYSTPITVLKFPIAPGESFVSTGQIVNGTADGLPYAGQDTYEVSVDAIGSVDLPSFVFSQVHRVRTKVTVEPAVGAAVTQLQVSFFAECFGEVARATSAQGETNPDFTSATELRRLGF